MGFVKVTVCIVLLVIAIFTYVVINHCRHMYDNAWKIITTQKLPTYIRRDPYLLNIFSNKMKERKHSKIGIVNLLYAYISPRGKLGDTSWSHLEELCKMTISKIPKEHADKITCIVSIASGGALIGPIIAKLLSIPFNKIYPVHISKWSSATTIMQRAKLYNCKESDVVLRVRKHLPKDISFESDHVLIVDDQACSGSTIKKCRELVSDKKPLSVYAAVISSSCKIPIPNVDTVGYHGFVYMWPFGVDS